MCAFMGLNFNIFFLFNEVLKIPLLCLNWFFYSFFHYTFSIAISAKPELTQGTADGEDE